MATRIFLSYPKAHTLAQLRFIDSLGACLRDRGFEPRTLGVNQYDADAPLTAIRRLMSESNGLVAVALRRLWVERGRWRKGAEVDGASESAASDVWLTSPYCQIEPAMAYQLGLPVLILRERGVVAEGLLEDGVVGTHLPEFSLDDDPAAYLESLEFASVLAEWEGYVRAVVQARRERAEPF